ncbi:MAG: hypothetical protein V4819_23415 [Verrucomicrobiota bacterium]
MTRAPLSFILAIVPGILIAADTVTVTKPKIDPGPLGAAIESGKDHRFHLAPAALYSEDGSEWTPSLQFDFYYQFAEAGKWPSEAFNLSVSANGAIAVDEDLNREPLRAHLDYYYMTMPGFDDAIDDWNKPLTASEPHRSNPFSFELGLSAAYETDQSFDNRNAVASGFVKFIQPRGNDWHAFLPSIIAAFDGVFPSENRTASSHGTDSNTHARFRAVADWEMRFSLLTENALVRPLTFHVAAEYSKDFGQPSSWERAGKDESFGIFAELSYALNTGIDPAGTAHESPFSLFVRATSGRIAPEPENDNTLLVGTRFGF